MDGWWWWGGGGGFEEGEFGSAISRADGQVRTERHEGDTFTEREREF